MRGRGGFLGCAVLGMGLVQGRGKQGRNRTGLNVTSAAGTQSTSKFHPIVQVARATVLTYVSTATQSDAIVVSSSQFPFIDTLLQVFQVPDTVMDLHAPKASFQAIGILHEAMVLWIWQWRGASPCTLCDGVEAL